MIRENDHLIVGVSGGADSVCLLHFLYNLKEEYNIKITVVHINHCMRGLESDEDSDFVLSFCNSLKIPLEIFKIDVYDIAKRLKITDEEAGRKARYDAFNRVLISEKANKIAVAHNKDDNAETILMRFLRGTGAKGLCGIPYTRENIIRPLLDCERTLIENYCYENELSYRTDSTNSEEIYTRNKIRLNLLPEIRRNFNSNITNSLVNMSRLFSKEDEFLENLAKVELSNVLITSKEDYFELDIEKINKLDDVIKMRMVRNCLSNFSLHNISSQHIDIILNLLNKTGVKRADLPNNVVAYCSYNALCISSKSIFEMSNFNSSVSYNYEIKQDDKIFIKELNKSFLLTKKQINIEKFSTKVYTLCLNCDKIENSIFLRQRNNGDKIFLNGMNKKIKNIFISSKIPSNERDFYPILVNKSLIIGILGLCVSDDYKPFENKIYLYSWEET